ncbi:MAG: amidohydrolase family protein [Desulfomonilia bacterium]|jgi:predicted TIM-barrel fold metal-dependent hydrolase
MVIDCHYHLEEGVLSREALLREMDRSGVEKAALMASMVGPIPEPPRPLIGIMQVMLEVRRLRGLARRFVAGFTPQGDIRILGRPFRIEPAPDNRKVFEALRKYPRRFLGWVFVNPRSGTDPVTELEQYHHEPGFIGVKAHPFWHHFTPVELVPVAEKLAETGKPLLIHCGFGPEGDFEALLRKVPELKLILAHAGFPEYGDTWRKVRHAHNVYLDLSQTSYVSARATRESVERLGPERLLFGTDGPYGFHGRDGRYDYGFIKRRIERLFTDEGVRRRLLGENFAELVLN